MTKKFLQLFILPIFVLVGFLLFVDTASAAYATSTLIADCHESDYDPATNLTQDEKYWFDGESLRFSFTPVINFCTWWEHRDYEIQRMKMGVTPTTYYSFENVGSGSGNSAFLETMDELNDWNADDDIFILWEEGQRYDTYITTYSVNPSGATDEDKLFHDIIADSDNYLEPISRLTMIDYYSYWRRIVSDNVYIDYDYSSEKRIDPVILVPGVMGSWNFGNGWELDPILNTYDNLWEALKLSGYIEGENLSAFPSYPVLKLQRY